MGNQRKRQAEASRARLVEAARTCFAEQGYEDTSVATVLERAEMARGALYHYFPGGKRDLFRAVFDSVNEAFHRRRDAVLALDSPLARIRAGIRAFLELCTEDEFAQIALMDAPAVIPGQASRGSSYELLFSQLEAAATADEFPALHVEATAMVLYGAVRSAGEFVVATPDRQRAVDEAMQSLDRILEALSV